MVRKHSWTLLTQIISAKGFIMMIALIAALGKKRQIGLQQKIPWRISADLKQFKELTWGHTLIMGRKTFESIGRALPGRETLILTHSRKYAPPANCKAFVSPNEMLEYLNAEGKKKAFVIGGGAIYELFMPHARELHLSHVDYDGPADAYFPAYDESRWEVVRSEEHPASANALAWSYSFLRLLEK